MKLNIFQRLFFSMFVICLVFVSLMTAETMQFAEAQALVEAYQLLAQQWLIRAKSVVKDSWGEDVLVLDLQGLTDQRVEHIEICLTDRDRWTNFLDLYEGQSIKFKTVRAPERLWNTYRFDFININL